MPRTPQRPSIPPEARPGVSGVDRSAADHRQDGERFDPADYRQNALGDVVIPVEHGEIVALPRLWDFGLAFVGPRGAVLRTPGGLAATVRFAGDSAVVDHVGEAGEPRRSLEVA